MGSLIAALAVLPLLAAALIFNHMRYRAIRPEPQPGVHERWDDVKRRIASDLADISERDERGAYTMDDVTGRRPR